MPWLRVAQLLALLVVELPAVAARARAQAPMSSTAFVDVSVIPMDRERVLSHQTVVVRGGHVVQLGPMAKVRVPPGARRVDGRGKYMVPGLADMHVHLVHAGGWSYDAALSDTAGRDSIILADAERQLFVLLANGVTTIRTADYRSISASRRNNLNIPPLRGPALLRLKARAAAGQILSPRIYASGNWRLDSTKNADENILLYKAAGYDHLKPYDEDSLLFDSIARAAHRLGMPVMGHGFGGADGAAKMTELGFTSLEHFTPHWNYFNGDTTGLQATIDAVAKAGIWNSPTTGLAGFITARSTSPTPLEIRYGPAEFALTRGDFRLDSSYVRMMTDTTSANRGLTDSTGRSGWRNLVLGFHKAGPGLLLGTDNGPHLGPAGFMIHRGLQFFVSAGLTPYEALQTGTVNVAKYLGTEDSTGTIAVGKRADLVLLDDNPLEDIRRTGDIAGVMIGGRWLSRAELERRLTAYYRGRVVPFDARAFVDVNVIPMDRDSVLAHQTVVVRDGKIVALGPMGRITVPSDAVRMDGRGKFLIPGLIDLHATVTSAAAARQELVSYLADGVTTVRLFDPKGYVRGWRPGLRPRVIGTGADWRIERDSSITANVGFAKSQGLRIAIDTVGENRAIVDSLLRAAQDSGVPVVRYGPGRQVGEHLALGKSVSHNAQPISEGSPSSAVQRGLHVSVQAGLRPYDALLAATVNAAKLLALTDTAANGTATIAVGQPADLVLLDANPLVDVRRVQSIAGVMLGGEWMSRMQIAWRRRHYVQRTPPD